MKSIITIFIEKYLGKKKEEKLFNMCLVIFITFIIITYLQIEITNVFESRISVWYMKSHLILIHQALAVGCTKVGVIMTMHISTCIFITLKSITYLSL